MVAGARLALEAGWEVRGSDGPLYPPTSEMVEALGVKTYEGYRAENLDWDPDLVVIGNALSRGNPEVEAALTRRMHFLSLPEWMKDHVLRDRRPIVCCGTHGKTTVTALTAFLLDQAGLGGGWLIAGQPLDFEYSASLGSSGAPFVIEGDEYDTAFFDKRSKFFHYLPEVAVVTSLEFDHGDIFGTLEDIRRALSSGDTKTVFRRSASPGAKGTGENSGFRWRAATIYRTPLLLWLWPAPWVFQLKTWPKSSQGSKVFDAEWRSFSSRREICSSATSRTIPPRSA
jgi:UDP-N-acetylmuramate-alanine ligase